MEQWIGWHFLDKSKRLAYGDERLVVSGETLSVPEDKPLVLCKYGMHASLNPLDALKLAPSFTIICRVELLGERIDGDNKSVARSRRVLWMADASDTVKAFAFACADRAVRIHAANAMDAAGLPNQAKILQELAPITTIETANAAGDAAGDAAWAAAGDAAGDAEEAWQTERLCAWLSADEPLDWPLDMPKEAAA